MSGYARTQPRLCAAVAVLTATLLAPALVGDAAAQTNQPRRGGTAVIVLGGDPPTVNPDVSTGIPDQLIGCMVYQGLTQISADTEVLPLLAKSWTISPDGLVYSFELNKAQWHDGKPFTSEDVKFSLTEVSTKYGSIFASAGRAIDVIETPAPDRVVIRLKKSFGPFLISLACAQGGAIMPAHIYKGTDVLQNPATTSKPVGTGAFMLSEWRRGDSIRLVRNPAYWEPNKPYLDGIVAKIIPQAAARTHALQAGEVDFVIGYYFQANDEGVVRANPQLKLLPAGFAPSSNLMFLNVNRKPLDDKRVRQALLMATDREFLLKTAWFGQGNVGIMPFNSQVKWAANADIDYRKLYPFDAARANALLDEAGVKRGADGTRFSVRLVYPSDAPDREQVALAVKGMWKAVGVDVVIDPIERATQVKRVFQDRDFDLTLQGYTTYGDPALGIARTFATAAIGRPFGNPSGYSNPEVDALFEQGEAATDLKERGAFYRKAQAILAADLPVFTLHEAVIMDAATRNLEGVWGGQGYGLWNNAWLAK